MSGFKWSSKSLQPSQQIALYAGCVSEDKFPKNIAPVGGAYFVGKMTVMDDAEAKKVTFYIVDDRRLFETKQIATTCNSQKLAYCLQQQTLCYLHLI